MLTVSACLGGIVTLRICSKPNSKLLFRGRKMSKRSGQIISGEPIKCVARWYGFSAYKPGDWSGSAILQWVGYEDDQEFNPSDIAEDEWHDIEGTELTQNSVVDFPSRPGFIRVKPGATEDVEYRVHGGTT